MMNKQGSNKMSTYNTSLFSKLTNSRKNGGAVEYYSDNVTLGVAADELFYQVNKRAGHMMPGYITLQIQETGAFVICQVTDCEYFDTAKTDVKAYILTPTPVAKHLQPEYANISVRIALRD
jgi:hypothetical protein